MNPLKKIPDGQNQLFSSDFGNPVEVETARLKMFLTKDRGVFVISVADIWTCRSDTLSS